MWVASLRLPPARWGSEGATLGSGGTRHGGGAAKCGAEQPRVEATGVRRGDEGALLDDLDEALQDLELDSILREVRAVGVY